MENVDHFRATRDQVREKYLHCVAETPSLTDSEAAWIGFIVGFRCYERMAKYFGQSLHQSELDRFVRKPPVDVTPDASDLTVE